ncbi:exopolysaccharide biosynthesis protein [Actinoplanes campanulatus]|uniref:Exopolysaccharide biosynthesis protein n=1 Tax=Actinoplanes campanulatus TaxID=113559 RepID=A0A7W5FDX3_9ACTN|nr:phosphodiester glycosidase family protein [Actinoplanes campanulatus]MBB3094898.1 exopolysaccharide biosynthesis protein [Actinoplanes campanulatus]GGN08221.1 exopolysaccharide biosynthesis protein [Actinoplanes campanulatus]GID36192.1 exopolysaccharide biosynthesis protein [Actinoplanes campanulatus]
MTNETAPARRIGRRGLLAGGLGLLAAAGGGGAWALDRYVLDHVEVSGASSLIAQNVVAAEADTDGTATATSYTSDTAKISIETVTTGSGDDRVTYFVADVQVTDATIVRSAFAGDRFGENIIANPSEIAAGAGAVLAINGDYYGFRDTGIVIRNGVKFRDKGARQGLALYADGSMRLYDESATSASELIADGVWNTLSFGPGLVDDGAVIDGIDRVEVDTNFGNHSIQGRQPRTGIGLVGANHLLFIVADGRSSGYSRGVTMPEFARIFADRGARTAYNLDGGGSSVMVFRDGLVNNPLGKGKERGTSDILYVAG